MRAGKLDKLITIERAVTTLDDLRAPIEVWTAIATVRAEIIQASTEEFIRARGASTETTIVFRIRFIDGLKLTDRIIFEDEAYNFSCITAVPY